MAEKWMAEKWGGEKSLGAWQRVGQAVAPGAGPSPGGQDRSRKKVRIRRSHSFVLFRSLRLTARRPSGFLVIAGKSRKRRKREWQKNGWQKNGAVRNRWALGSALDKQSRRGRGRPRAVKIGAARK